MVLLAEERVAYQYVADNGDKYAILGKYSVHNQGVTGATACDGTEVRQPFGFKPRVAIVYGNAKRREVVCFTTAATLWTTGDTSINLDVDDVSTAFAGGGEDDRREEVKLKRNKARKVHVVPG